MDEYRDDNELDLISETDMKENQIDNCTDEIQEDNQAAGNQMVKQAEENQADKAEENQAYKAEENQAYKVEENQAYKEEVNQAYKEEVNRADKKEKSGYKKTKKQTSGKRNGPVQLILIALISSMLGAGSIFAAFSIVPSAFGLSNGSSTEAASGSSGLNVTGVSTYKSVTIEESTSPVSAIAEKVGPSVVGVKVTTASQQSNFFFSSEESTSEGSGIIISEDGYILTNNHVVEGALTSGTNDFAQGAKIEVILPDEQDKSYTATLVGRDSSSDMAVLKIEATGLPKAELGDSDDLKTGELAVAIGNPGGLDYMGSVTAGIISGLNRTLETEDGKELNLIQTDAAINPGNSGGALCNSSGQVIGINTVKIAATGYEGLGFAIPINSAKQIAQDLIDYKYVKGRPLLGLSIDQRFTSDVAASNNVPAGLLVADVTTYGPAEKAGIQVNDIITEFDGKAVTTFSDLDAQKDTHKPGDNVVVEVYRDGKTLALTVTLGEQKI
jgi:serine protease Do